MFGYAHHTLVLLLSIAVAGLALFGAIAVGPYGRRGLRTMLGGVAFAGFLGSVFWIVTYITFIEERRSIEGRLSELRGQALRAGSTLACLEHTGERVESACGQTLFGTPESLSAAHLYMGARLDLLMAAARYTGPRTAEFDIAITALQRSLQQDPFGLTSRTLVLREGCTAQRCDTLSAFQDTERLRNNIRQDTFAANVARYAGTWRVPAATTAPASPALTPSASDTKAPIPEKYTLPSASSIPPVSIMDDEPAERPAAAPAPGKDRSAGQQTAPAATASSEQPVARREPKRANAPLSITPKQ